MPKRSRGKASERVDVENPFSPSPSTPPRPSPAGDPSPSALGRYAVVMRYAVIAFYLLYRNHFSIPRIHLQKKRIDAPPYRTSTRRTASVTSNCTHRRAGSNATTRCDSYRAPTYTARAVRSSASAVRFTNHCHAAP